MRRPSGDHRGNQTLVGREGELPPIGPVREAPPKRPLGVAHVGDPSAVAGELDVARGKAPQKRHEEAGGSIVTDEFGSRAGRGAERENSAPIGTDGGTGVAHGTSGELDRPGRAALPPPRIALGQCPKSGLTVPVRSEEEVPAVGRPTTSRGIPAGEERARGASVQPRLPDAARSARRPRPCTGTAAASGDRRG